MRLRLAEALLIALAACGDHDGTGADAAIDGSYTLSTVNGASLPAPLPQTNQERQEVTSGTLLVNRNNTFSLALSVTATRLSDGAVFIRSFASTGSWTRSGTSVSFNGPGSVQLLAGTVSAGTLTLAGDVLGPSATFVFRE